MLLLTERLIILLIDQRRGRIEKSSSDLIFYGLPSAIIIDLEMLNLIKIRDDNKIEIISSETTHPIFKSIIEEMQNEHENDIRFWIRSLGIKSNQILESFIEVMLQDGILTKIEKRFLFFKRRKIFCTEESVKIELMHQLQETIINSKKATMHTKLLLAILYKCNKITLCLNKGLNEMLLNEVREEIRDEKFGEIITELIRERNELMNAIFSTYLINTSLV
ncbi:MAG: GPP34 family phosphoprotein [Candidatus Heimdallarchaeum endolithica]|uniref:GPP34 family phosphoprotein n=1 Tax=Candidatus Heimdallarchaeum endolithica TaxID=2876572 RepID=A0A9Y1FN23_9ARCH|nr:MAG: GPP34 family phosphoprotein [Candidatus Heimdallarchaeum endolithica]